MLKKNVYVMLSGTIRQRGEGRPHFQPEPPDKAEFEFNLTQVELLRDTQKKYVRTLMLKVPAENATAELGDLLLKQFTPKETKKKKTKDDTDQDLAVVPIKVQIIDTKHNDSVTTLSNRLNIKLTRDIYIFLRDLQNEGRISYSILT